MKATRDSVVWITGASSGIGKALTEEYAKTGCRIILSSRNENKLNNVRNGFESTVRQRMAVLPLDLAKSETLQETTDRAISVFGHIDILINNGGISQRSLGMDTSLEVFRRLMEVNYFGNIALTKSLLPHLSHRKSGHIAVTSSVVGKFGSPYRTGYAASKHALHGFYDSLRAELYGSGIEITMICPGFIRTNISLHSLTEDGSPLDEMDEAQAKGMDPSVCAKKIHKALDAGKREIYMGGKEVYGVYLKRFLPGVFASILPRLKVR